MRTHSQRRLDPGEGGPSDFAWRVIGLVNLYRLLVACGLFAASRSENVQDILGIERPGQLALISAAWLLVGIGLIALRRLPAVGLRLLALSYALVDAVAIGFVLWATNGVESGLGILVLLPVAAMAMLTGPRDALFMAATAAVAVLAQQLARELAPGPDAGGYLNAGVLGVVIFLAALLPRLLIARMSHSEALLRRQEVDLANLAHLSQYIVARLRESILVVDETDRIRLINEPAAGILGSSSAWPGALLGECSPRLLYLLSGWRQHGGAQEPDSFTAADGARLIQPHFAPLGSARPGPVLIFLEDTSLIAEKVQQSKLAALGRLSASIAHEIRTPIAAMSHAGQLLAESPHIPETDRRLTRIIRDNAERVSRIIEDVLEFSRRSTRRPQRLELPDWIAEFCAEFCATQQVGAHELCIAVSPDEGVPLAVSVDPTQLRQVMWNLCRNALTHGRRPDVGEPVEIRYGRLAGNGRPFVEVRDRGPGIAAEDAERVFEPFFTTAARGTGLGLFLARELAESNGAALLHESPPDGGTLFRLVFTDPGRWQE
ncbi:MAG TPA: ATP-binding protein [Steroidobacteraceae bacterium]|nr:ATP-binding protein [Steroidobacteraceae bacterium]